MSVNKVNSDGSTTVIAGSNLYSDMPLATVIGLFTDKAPSGFLYCDDTAYRKADYPELWELLPSTVKDTTNETFTIDLRESTLKGVGTTSKTVGAHQAVALGEFLDDRVQEHKHYRFSADNNGSSYAGTQGTGNWTPSSTDGQYGNETGHIIDARHGATTEVKSTGIRWYIKARQIAIPADFLAKVDEAVVENNEYSTTETVVGKWIDGKPIYRKVCVIPSDFMTAGQSWVSTGVNKPSNINKLVSVSLVNRPDGKSYNLDFDCIGSTDIKVSTLHSSSLNVLANSYFTIEYTKTTD